MRARIGKSLARTRVVVFVAVALLLLGGVTAAGRIGGSQGPAGGGAARLVAAHESPPARICPTGRMLNIVAHEDDDLLFLSPDLLHDIHAGKCVRTIFVTAGNDGKGPAYWRQGREAGSRAAYAEMAGVRDAWTQDHIRVNGHRIVMFKLSGDPRVSLIFLRLPDGGSEGTGFTANHDESVMKLRDGDISVIHAVDGSTSYTKAGLLATVTRLVDEFHPNVIRTQNYVTPDAVGYSSPDDDHSDHHASAYLAQAASRQYRAPHSFIGYQDYYTRHYRISVFGSNLAAKEKAFFAYDKHDSLLPCSSVKLLQTAACKHAGHYAQWLAREYRVGPGAGPGWYIGPCTVPAVAGQLFEPAEAAIGLHGCAVGEVSHVASDTVDDGDVIGTTPGPSPKRLPEGTKVSITVSDGPGP